MNWQKLLDLVFRYRHHILNAGGSGLSLLAIWLVNRRLKKLYPQKYSEMVKYISGLNLLIAIATGYSIYRFNASKLLEEHLYFLLGLIAKKIAPEKQKEQQVKSFREMQNYNMRVKMEQMVVKLQIELRDQINLWEVRKKDLAALPDSLEKIEISNNFEERIATMTKRLKKLKELQKMYGEQMPNSFGINIYWIIGAFTILLAIKSPNIKIIVLMEKILSYFTDPDPYSN
jgi:hypothetical protein